MSDNEIDAELLAMAGDDSSSDEEVQDSKADLITPRSPSQEAQQSVETADDGGKKGVAKKVRARRGTAKKRRKEESEEEGEASASSSPGSLGSGAMSESDGEPQAPDAPASDEDAPLYPLEGKFADAADRARILALPEVEREEIIAHRAEASIKRTQDQQLKKALASSKAAAGRHKRSVADAQLDDGVRKSSRPKVVKTAPSALDDYRKARELKGAARTRIDTQRVRRGDSSSSRDRNGRYSDADAEGSEVEFYEPPARRDEPPPEQKDFEHCRVGRSNFAKIYLYPTFESTIKGCYCRVSIGVNRETGLNTYRMAQIKGLQAGKPYQMDGPNGKPLVSDQYLLAAHGRAEKAWPFNLCSDSPLTAAELARYLATLTRDKLPAPSRTALRNKVADIHALLDHRWTDSDIESKLTHAADLQRRFAEAAREKLQARRADAGRRGDADAVARCERELGVHATIKHAIPVYQEELRKRNEATRRANAAEVRTAELAEKRRYKEAREEARGKRAAAEQDNRGGAGMLAVPLDMRDLFGEGSEGSRAGTPRAGTPVGRKRGPAGGGKKRGMDDEVIGRLDLGIEIEI